MGRCGTTIAALVLLVTAGCRTGASPTQQVTTMRLTSPAFGEGEAIPPRHTCDGEDVSPPLAWDGPQDGVAAYALIVEDLDARGFVHWVLTDLPGDTRGLGEGEGDAVGVPGRNDFARAGWGGPCPPPGQHRYLFTLYALSEPIEVGDGATADAVRDAMAGRVVAEATLTGVYARGG